MERKEGRWSTKKKNARLYATMGLSEQKRFLAIFSGTGWLDGWRMIAGDDT
jgi:hypothetical protein